MPCLAEHMTDDAIIDLMEPILEIADRDLFASDPEWNALVKAAAAIRDREGFLVVPGDKV